MNLDNVPALGEDSTRVADVSPYGNNGTPRNHASPQVGKYGGAYSYDGVDDYIEVADSSSLDITAGITVCVWVKVAPGSPDRQVVLEKGGWEGGEYGLFAE